MMPHMMELLKTMRLSQKIRLTKKMETKQRGIQRLPHNMRLFHQKMMLPHIMELLKTMRLPHKIRLAKKMLQDEISSIDKASSHVEAVFLHSGCYYSQDCLYGRCETLPPFGLKLTANTL